MSSRFRKNTKARYAPVADAASRANQTVSNTVTAWPSLCLPIRCNTFKNITTTACVSPACGNCISNSKSSPLLVLSGKRGKGGKGGRGKRGYILRALRLYEQKLESSEDQGFGDALADLGMVQEIIQTLKQVREETDAGG